MSNQKPKIWVCLDRSNGKISLCHMSKTHVRAGYKDHYSEVLSCHAYKCATVTGLAQLWCKPPWYWCSICWEKKIFLLAKVPATSNLSDTNHLTNALSSWSSCNIKHKDPNNLVHWKTSKQNPHPRDTNVLKTAASESWKQSAFRKVPV